MIDSFWGNMVTFMKQLIASLIALLTFSFGCLVFAQSNSKNALKYTISGFVEDATSGEKLIGANVYDPNRLDGTTTNVYGFFSLTLPSDSATIAVAYIGYQTAFFRLELDKDIRLNVSLTPTGVLGDTVEVVAEAVDLIEEQTLMSKIDVPIAQIRSLPALLGETDVLKTLQLLPGVQSGNEGASGIYVRGGGPDQNLILLDGAPVYNASHLFGFFSVFNSDAVKNVRLTKGGFPARFGGRLSSVVEINMKEGNNQRFKGAASIGLVASRVMLEGPIQKGRSSFIISGRRTYVDVLARPFINKNGDSGGYFFYDLNAKINHAFSNKSRIFLSVYAGDDQFYAREKNSFDDAEFNADLGWGNITATLRWNRILSSKLFSNATLTYSKYKFDINVRDRGGSPEAVSSSANYFSGIRDWSARLDFDYLPSPRHTVKFGGDVIHHTFSPGAFQFTERGGNDPVDVVIAPSGEINSIEASAYLEDDIKFSDAFTANLGVHSSAFWVNNKFYSSFQPRLSTRYRLNGGWAFKGSFSLMRQYIHLLTNSGIGLPTDLWVPATDRVKPQQSWQGALGIARSLWDHQFEFSVEAYYKTMDNLIEYKEGASFIGLDSDWQNKVETGSGRSYGGEIFIQKKRGKTTGWLGYTLSWTNRTFDAINDGKTFPFRYDRRHDLSLVLTHDLTGHWQFSSNFVFGSGTAVTLPVARLLLNTTGSTVSNRFFGNNNNPFAFYGGELFLYSDRNAFRMRNYHRLDVSLRWHKNKRLGGRIFSISVYNIYSRKNPYFLFLGTNDRGDRVMKQISLFPIIPAVSYRFTF